MNPSSIRKCNKMAARKAARQREARWFWYTLLLGFTAMALAGCAPSGVFGIFHWFDVAWHWFVAFANVAIVAGIGVLGFLYSPFFKTAFLGVAVGAVALSFLNLDIVNFNKMLGSPQSVDCINPSIDPNGPTSRCWHATDDRGYGYWGACEGQQ